MGTNNCYTKSFVTCSQNKRAKSPQHLHLSQGWISTRDRKMVSFRTKLQRGCFLHEPNSIELQYVQQIYSENPWGQTIDRSWLTSHFWFVSKQVFWVLWRGREAEINLCLFLHSLHMSVYSHDVGDTPNPQPGIRYRSECPYLAARNWIFTMETTASALVPVL